MALQGTLDTVPLTDVLSLLASTAKVGRLQVVGAQVEGALWVDGPEIVGAVLEDSTDPVDVLVELLRLSEGAFRFDPGELPPGTPVHHAIDDAMAEASGRLAEWQAIEAVLPSAEHVVTLRPALEAPEVRVPSEVWRAVAAIGAGGSVADLVTRLGGSAMDGARALAALVEAGLAEVTSPGVVGAGRAGAQAIAVRAAADPVPEPLPPVAPADAQSSVAAGAEELGTGQPWRDQVRQLLASAPPEPAPPASLDPAPPEPPSERFGPPAAGTAGGRGPADGTAPPSPEPPAADADRDVLLRFLSSVQP